MAYTKQTWENLPSQTTPINADRLTHIEDGIFNAAATADTAASDASSAISGLADKVDKVEGKGLSTNDFTDALKTKLDGIATGAEVNVQSDWNQSDNSADDYIKNKPSLGTASAKNSTSIITNSTDLVESGAVENIIGWGNKNLLPNNAISQTINGVTFTPNSDGSVTVNGTATANTFFKIFEDNNHNVSWNGYKLTGCPSGGGNSTYRLDLSNVDVTSESDVGDGKEISVDTTGKIIIRIRIGSGYTANNLVFYPMISKEGGAYEPYHASVEETLRDAEVVKNKNLVDYILYGCNIDLTGGIAYDGSFTMAVAKVKSGVTYAITTNDDNKVYGFFTSKPLPGLRSYNNQRVVTNVVYFTSPIDGYVAFRTALDYETPQLEVGSTATAYEPYYTPLKDVVPTKADNSVIGTVENGTTASQAYAVNDVFIRNGALCKVTSAISQGDTLSNQFTVTNVGAILTALLNA